jgi:hypothetical protein
MTHFIGAVIVPAGEKDESGYLSRVLARYDEQENVPDYISLTKEQAIAKWREEIEADRVGMYARYLADPEEYAKNVTNPHHLDYLKNDFPKKLAYTDEEAYADAIKFYNEEEIDADGNIHSTYNPDSWFDWYVVGGRWNNAIFENNRATIAEWLTALHTMKKPAGFRNPPSIFEFVFGPENNPEFYQWDKARWPRGVVTTNEELVKRGEEGWFGYTANGQNDEEWRQTLMDTLRKESLSSTVVFIDFHI